MTIQKISEDIYNNFEPREDYRKYFIQFLSELNKVDIKQFLIYSLRQDYFTNYIQSLLKNLPELWNDRGTSFWIDILEQNTPRLPEIRISPFLNSIYDDFKFLHKYIKVNPFVPYLESKNISVEDKINVILHCEKFHFLFLPREQEDKEDYEDGFFYSFNLIETYRRKLIKEGLFSEGFADAESLKEYLHTMSISISV